MSLLIPCTFAHAQEAPAALLRQMAQAESHAQYSGTEVLEAHGAARETRRIWRQGNKQRLEWLEPPVRAGDVLVDNGTDVWLYHRTENSATQTKSAPPRLGLRAAGIGKTFDASSLGSQTIAGRKAWGIAIMPKRGAKAAAPTSAAPQGSEPHGGRRLWIDDATKIALRRERLGPGGKVRESSELRDLNVGPVPAGRFRFTPPRNAQVTRTAGALFMQIARARRSASWLQAPTHLPAGYQFESAVVDAASGEAWLRYSTGGSRFSIFQQRVADSATKELQTVDGGFYWQGGGSRFIVVGLPQAGAATVSKSMR